MRDIVAPGDREKIPDFVIPDAQARAARVNAMHQVHGSAGLLRVAAIMARAVDGESAAVAVA